MYNIKEEHLLDEKNKNNSKISFFISHIFFTHNYLRRETKTEME